MKVVGEKQHWMQRPYFYVAAGFCLAALLAFTNPTAPSRHFGLVTPIGLSNLYAVTVSGDANSTGVPVPGTQVIISGAKLPSAAPNDGGTTIPYIEYGRDVFSGTTKTVTFKTTFAVAPACTCTDGTAIAACDIPIATISQTQMVVNGTTGDKFSWICVGDGT